MSPCECKTVHVLRHHVENKTECEHMASVCLSIIENIWESGLSELSFGYLHEFVDTFYKDAGLPLFDHLQESVDCEICKAIASRL